MQNKHVETIQIPSKYPVTKWSVLRPQQHQQAVGNWNDFY